jgi:hypothetical protein
MKTDDLIAMLGKNVEPVERARVERTVNAAVLLGAAVALCVMFVIFGVRTDLNGDAVIFLPFKLAFTMATVVPATIYMIQLARPGSEQRMSTVLAALPFIAVVLLAAISLALAPPSHWKAMVIGDRWLECLLSIPVIAILPFAVIVWAVRKMAPTDLTRAGAVAGLLAGGVSATGYALHCTDDSLPFVALWYGGTIVLCTFAGAKLGPQLLRW